MQSNTIPSPKQNTPNFTFLGVKLGVNSVTFCNSFGIVELAGIEPASKHGTNMLSTCLVLL